MGFTRLTFIGLVAIALAASGALFAEDSYPTEVSELAYFSASDGWGDPDSQDRFRSIRISKSSFVTVNGEYSSLTDLIDKEGLADLEGVGVFFTDLLPEEEEKFMTLLRDNGVLEIVTNRDDVWFKARRLYLNRETGTVFGIVTAAESGEPLQWSDVSSEAFGDYADEQGKYEVSYLDPGTVRLVASRPDRKRQDAKVEVLGGERTEVNFVLELAPPACCALDGEWNIELTITEDRRPPDYMPENVVDTATGTVEFSEAYLDPVGRGQTDDMGSIKSEYGEYNIDLTPFFGEHITASISNTIVAGSNQPDILKQVHGAIYSEDKVSITFIPRMSHGGISLSGTITNNRKIEGKWYKRDFAVMLSGTFEMTRTTNPQQTP